MPDSKLSALVIDCKTGDVDAATRFWAQALRREAWPADAAFPLYRKLKTRLHETEILVQAVDHPSRVHIDIEADDVDAEVARIEALGAKALEKVRDWVVLEAPTGQRFCVVPAKRPVDLVAKARAYLAAIERGAQGDELASFFTEDVAQEEFPNRLVPGGAKRDLAALLEGAAKGQKILTSQRYEVLKAFANGRTVVLEVAWSATFSIPLGEKKPGEEVRARFAVFLEYSGDKIAVQRNYDCFEPF